MIDTVKFSCVVSDETKRKIQASGQVRNKYDLETGEIFYNIVQNSVEGSYSSSINVSFGEIGYNTYKLYIEGSLHKVLMGQNAYNGFYNLQQICKIMRELVVSAYNVELPKAEEFYVERIDIAKCFDLETQENIYEYLYMISFLSYPRRKVLYIEKESVYVPGRTCTLKIYNKLLEFRKHDKNDLQKLNMERNDYEHDFNVDYFDILSFEYKVQGFLRFELEIHKRMLVDLFGKNDIFMNEIDYSFLEKIWKGEFMKLFSMKKEKYITDRLKVKDMLINEYGKTTGNTLYDFYIRLTTEGESYLKHCSSKSSFYRKRKMLQDVGIDFSKRYIITEEDNVSSIVLTFNPFENLREVS